MNDVNGIARLQVEVNIGSSNGLCHKVVGEVRIQDVLVKVVT